jgi:hypothetical protein
MPNVTLEKKIEDAVRDVLDGYFSSVPDEHLDPCAIDIASRIITMLPTTAGTGEALGEGFMCRKKGCTKPGTQRVYRADGSMSYESCDEHASEIRRLFDEEDKAPAGTGEEGELTGRPSREWLSRAAETEDVAPPSVGGLAADLGMIEQSEVSVDWPREESSETVKWIRHGREHPVRKTENCGYEVYSYLNGKWEDYSYFYLRGHWQVWRRVPSSSEEERLRRECEEFKAENVRLQLKQAKLADTFDSLEWHKRALEDLKYTVKSDREKIAALERERDNLRKSFADVQDVGECYTIVLRGIMNVLELDDWPPQIGKNEGFPTDLVKFFSGYVAGLKAELAAERERWARLRDWACRWSNRTDLDEDWRRGVNAALKNMDSMCPPSPSESVAEKPERPPMLLATDMRTGNWRWYMHDTYLGKPCWIDEAFAGRRSDELLCVDRDASDAAALAIYLKELGETNETPS